MELNREQQTIKVLQCISRTGDVLCAGCDYRKYDGLACHRIGAKDALALIRELTEENESRKQTIDQLGKNNDEIARVYPLAIKEAKADTVRKIQKRLKAKAYTNNYGQDVVLLSNIDQIAKEMLEEGK